MASRIPGLGLAFSKCRIAARHVHPLAILTRDPWHDPSWQLLEEFLQDGEIDVSELLGDELDVEMHDPCVVPTGCAAYHVSLTHSTYTHTYIARVRVLPCAQRSTRRARLATCTRPATRTHPATCILHRFDSCLPFFSSLARPQEMAPQPPWPPSANLGHPKRSIQGGVALLGVRVKDFSLCACHSMRNQASRIVCKS